MLGRRYDAAAAVASVRLGRGRPPLVDCLISALSACQNDIDADARACRLKLSLATSTAAATLHQCRRLAVAFAEEAAMCVHHACRINAQCAFSEAEEARAWPRSRDGEPLGFRDAACDAVATAVANRSCVFSLIANLRSRLRLRRHLS